MNIPSDKLRDLIQAIRKTKEYKRYTHVRTELEKDIERKQQIDEFRREKYRMQQFGADMYAASDELQDRYRHLLEQPDVIEYLELENSVCRMIREICDEIVRQVPMDLPDID